MGLLHPSLAARVHTSPIGLVPKSQSDKWWMIVDLSAPEGASVNDGIDADVCSLHTLWWTMHCQSYSTWAREHS